MIQPSSMMMGFDGVSTMKKRFPSQGGIPKSSKSDHGALGIPQLTGNPFSWEKDMEIQGGDDRLRLSDILKGLNTQIRIYLSLSLPLCVYIYIYIHKI